jgi:hypothetical protein
MVHKRKHEDDSQGEEEPSKCAKYETQKNSTLSEYFHDVVLENKEASLSDITITVRDTTTSITHQWYLHKFILMRSDYFKSLLLGPWKDSNLSELSLDEVLQSVPGCNMSSIQACFEYLYVDSIDTVASADIVPIVHLAQFLQLELLADYVLKNHCNGFVKWYALYELGKSVSDHEKLTLSFEAFPVSASLRDLYKHIQEVPSEGKEVYASFFKMLMSEKLIVWELKMHIAKFFSGVELYGDKREKKETLEKRRLLSDLSITECLPVLVIATKENIDECKEILPEKMHERLTHWNENINRDEMPPMALRFQCDLAIGNSDSQEYKLIGGVFQLRVSNFIDRNYCHCGIVIPRHRFPFALNIEAYFQYNDSEEWEENKLEKLYFDCDNDPVVHYESVQMEYLGTTVSGVLVLTPAPKDDEDEEADETKENEDNEN